MTDSSPRFDLLLKGGHVIDPANGIDGLRDVAIADGRIAAVAPSLDASRARKVVDVTVHRLRRKLGAIPQGRTLIRTVRGQGYTFVAPERFVAA